jgi:AraC-like DNA-binding protein
MLNNGLDAASAAFEVGYESATQFNREYSRFFGQPPMRDVRALLSPGQASKDFRLLLIGFFRIISGRKASPPTCISETPV